MHPDPQPAPHTCDAMTRAGTRCASSPMKGGKRCRMHGGSSPQALAAGARRVEEQSVVADLARLGVPVGESADPLAVLSTALSVAAGDLNAMRAVIAQVAPTDAWNPRLVLYAQTLDRAGRLAELASRTRLAERMADREAACTESQVATMTRALDVALDPIGLPDAARAAAVKRMADALRNGGAHD